ncbi:MAG TPA: phosphoribosylformylglycinamidine cyclo-ligase [Candidatus Hydrogenedentes bacterium]|nr:phosphoribosylformylglycinamidine cyclo-ligase [Candidatus Hydrogenedentota bacterium]
MNHDTPGLSYKDAGVDIDAANAALARAKEAIKRTFNDNVLQDIGSFGAMYLLDIKDMEAPVLVSSVDGVGTKLKLAFMTNKHDTVGVDLVSHSVNDILVQGARPLFFLDYLAAGKVDPEIIGDVIRGVAAGCRYAGCALIGGETAEMPGMYAENEYDLAGTIVGVVDRKNIVDGSRIAPGDVVVGLPSSGLHTNGYSLARRIVFDVAKLRIEDEVPGLGKTVAAALMEPHISYAKLMQIVMKLVEVRGMAHVTGGGITDNLPRALPDGFGVEIDLSSWSVPRLFTFLKEAGRVADAEMLRTFNMGIGFLFIVPEKQAAKAVQSVEMAGQQAMVVGKVVTGERKVTYTGTLQYA